MECEQRELSIADISHVKPDDDQNDRDRDDGVENKMFDQNTKNIVLTLKVA